MTAYNEGKISLQTYQNAIGKLRDVKPVYSESPTEKFYRTTAQANEKRMNDLAAQQAAAHQQYLDMQQQFSKPTVTKDRWGRDVQVSNPVGYDLFYGSNATPLSITDAGNVKPFSTAANSREYGAIMKKRRDILNEYNRITADLNSAQSDFQYNDQKHAAEKQASMDYTNTRFSTIRDSLLETAKKSMSSWSGPVYTERPL